MEHLTYLAIMADEQPNLGGRPPIFETPEQFEKAVDEYIANTPVNEITITGLCMWLGFATRQSLYDYEKKPGFTFPALKARLAVENSYERTLRTVAAPGSIFALKNMGWKDRNEVAPVDPDGNALKQELTIKIVRDTASSITPGDFTPQSAEGTESGEKV